MFDLSSTGNWYCAVNLLSNSLCRMLFLNFASFHTARISCLNMKTIHIFIYRILFHLLVTTLLSCLVPFHLIQFFLPSSSSSSMSSGDHKKHLSGSLEATCCTPLYPTPLKWPEWRKEAILGGQLTAGPSPEDYTVYISTAVNRSCQR